MITVEDALRRIDEHTALGSKIEISLAEAYGYILAENVLAPISMPPFRQSSMDGYALQWSENKAYTVVGEVQAGIARNSALQRGEAVRIFTGARVPDDADTVIIQEHTTREAAVLNIDKMPPLKANIRPKGEQVQTGDLVLEEGTVLNEAAIGFLAGLGFHTVPVFEPPKVGILVTGNELQQPGQPLREGQIYESNSITLQMALKCAGIPEVSLERVGDDLGETVNAVKKLLQNCDLLLISGGISVGDYDFVQEALEKNEVHEVFYKINQKPGKPLWFGTQGKKKVFALPGNPASSLTCFYVYVWPALRKIRGVKTYKTKEKTAKLETPIKNPFGKVLFLKATVSDGEARQLGAQASSMLKSFAICNALLIVPADKEVINPGEEIRYIALDQL
ncbi:MAG TPA: molybdopterin molybdenumtransferase MoeA [Leeuwenhoekiella sp.]|nr:molybdopterin molybdenumtransferase MoeA [Leeuwenhoekiella sp.]